LLREGIKLIYVFDGKPPALKKATHELRQEIKDEAAEKYEKAVEEENVEDMGKYARQIVKLDKEKIEESKKLLSAMGIAIIEAPSEGEAQASYIARNEDNVYAIASQDYDCLLFDVPRLIQNLTLAKKRKISSGSYVDVVPQMIELKEVYRELGLDRDQLICIGVLCGTDYNPGGVKGIGPMKALKLVKEFKTPDKVFEEVVKMNDGKYKVEFDWRQIFDLMKNPQVNKEYRIEFGKFDFLRVKEIMLEHDFSEERIESQFEKIKELNEQKKQKTLF
jgi:flap endonuclease-1